MKAKMIKLISLVAILFTLPIFVFASADESWSYGCNNNPNNWGAFSNYYHRTSKHWSNVVRKSDSKSSYSEAGPGKTSKAFINTAFGETAYFGRGLKK